MLPLALDRTVALPLVTEDGERADVWLTFSAAVVVVLAFPGANAEVDDADAESAALEAGLSNAFPELVAAPDPAPDDEPALFDAIAAGAVLMDVD